MKRTVFYSWQSDLPNAENRSLIETSLKRAITAIGRDQDAGLEPVLDRDTANVAGSPDIAHSILAKIAMADVFVADISIINSGARRPTPNPNVLIELGYAVAELGWDNVILVQNSAYGGPEDLPFDLRGRRTIVYNAPTEEANRAEIRGLLQGRLEASLKSALETGPAGSLPSGKDAMLWYGPWKFNAGGIAGGTLLIREISPVGFLFDLQVHHGAHSGSITAFARIVSNDLAYCRVPNGEDESHGEIIFRRRLLDRQRVIDIEEASACSYYRGVRAHFGGTFIREYEPWFDWGFMNELEIARMYTLLGQHLSKMRSCTGDIDETKCLDEDLDARVVWGGVAGLYTYMQSIVMYNSDGGMWAAFIDEEVVRYFTNVPAYRNVLPKTIENWRANFADKVVLYCDPVSVVPENQM